VRGIVAALHKTALEPMHRLRVLVLSIGGVLAATGCDGGAGNQGGSSPAKGGPPPAPPISVATVIEREVRDADEFSGRLEAFETVEVRARVSGVVTRVGFAAGREVRKGDLLFALDARPFQAELARAEAELARATTRADYARSELARAEKLLVSRAISQQEYDERLSGNRESEVNILAARAAIDVVKLNLEFANVTAPISGRVGRAEVTQGNWINGGSVGATLLTTIVAIDPMYAYFEGDEQVYLRVQARGGDRSGASRPPIVMGLANEEGYPHKGVVDFVDTRLDPKSGTIRVRAVFPNPDRRLAPGLFARLRMEGSAKYRALLVTDRAIGTDQNQKFVLAVGPNNVLQYRPVTPGALVDGLRVIKSGLAPGDLIVVNGLQRVRPGMPVTPQTVPMETDVPGAAATAAGKSNAADAKKP
jgi:RND family efflux transporter MFP subunit